MKMNEEIIGYKKPPRRTQFQPGQSGNPKGRPKRRGKTELESIGAVVVSEMNETVEVTENGKRINITKLRLALKQIMAKSAQGDLSAARMFVNLVQKFGDKAEVEKYAERFASTKDFESMTPEEAWREAQRLDDLAGP